jgi:protein tyrosine phosphatase
MLSTVIERLYLGGLDDLTLVNLNSFEITHILSVIDDFDYSPIAKGSITRKVLYIPDDHFADIYQYFDECIDFIDEALKNNGKVLVHCALGVSRSPTVVMAYLMKKCGMEIGSAYSHLKSVRPKIHPINNFLKQLSVYELMGCNNSEPKLTRVHLLVDTIKDSAIDFSSKSEDKNDVSKVDESPEK